MIKSFGDKATEKLWNGGRVRQFEQIAKTARRRLDELHRATTIAQAGATPGAKLHAMTGRWIGWWSIRVSDKWRIIFRWTAEGPEEVTLTDYHDRL